MLISLQRLPFDLHVLCAPPAFILSQDQTLLLMVFIFSVISFNNLRINHFWVFCSLINFGFVFYFGSTNYYRLVFSKVCLLFTFQCTFCYSLWCVTFCILLLLKQNVNTFFKTFLKSFLFVFFVQNNKLVSWPSQHFCLSFFTNL